MAKKFCMAGTLPTPIISLDGAQGLSAGTFPAVMTTAAQSGLSHLGMNFNKLTVYFNLDTILEDIKNGIPITSLQFYIPVGEKPGTLFGTLPPAPRLTSGGWSITCDAPAAYPSIASNPAVENLNTGSPEYTRITLDYTGDFVTNIEGNYIMFCAEAGSQAGKAYIMVTGYGEGIHIFPFTTTPFAQNNLINYTITSSIPQPVLLTGGLTHFELTVSAEYQPDVPCNTIFIAVPFGPHPTDLFNETQPLFQCSGYWRASFIISKGPIPFLPKNTLVEFGGYSGNSNPDDYPLANMALQQKNYLVVVLQAMDPASSDPEIWPLSPLSVGQSTQLKDVLPFAITFSGDLNSRPGTSEIVITEMLWAPPNPVDITKSRYYCWPLTKTGAAG